MGVGDAFKALGRGLKKAAPTMANVLLTAVPGGPLAQAAVSAAASALGQPGETDPAALTKVLPTASAEELSAVRKADQQFQLELRKLAVEDRKIDATDRASARKMQIATASKTAPALAWTIVISFVVLSMLLIWLLFFAETEMPAAAATLIGSIWGGAFALANQVSSYFFGSNRATEDATQRMTDAVANGHGRF